MRGKVTLVAGLVAVLIALPAGSQGEEPNEARTVPVRSFERFQFDTATVKGFWGEVGFLYEKTNFTQSEVTGLDLKLKSWTPFARLAYGGELWEADLFIPYRDLDGKVNGFNFNESGIGDIEATGRFIPLHTDLFDAGVGANFSFPSGDENDGLGTGEVGALPFFTAALNLAALEARGHVGWRFFTGDNNDQTAYDQLVYGFGLFLPLFDRVVFRNEFDGVQSDQPNKPKIVNYIAGLDFRVPIGGLDLLLRPTGEAGITHRSPDWGVGFSIALTSPTMRPAKAANMVGGVVIEE
jgi:hypothetical protein